MMRWRNNWTEKPCGRSRNDREHSAFSGPSLTLGEVPKPVHEANVTHGQNRPSGLPVLK